MKTIRSVGTLIECEGRILILQRTSDTPQGGTWGLPAGKTHEGESDIDTAAREVFEETGYRAKKEELALVATFDWQFPEVRVVFPTFKIIIKKPFDARLNPHEHMAYQWITPKACYHLPNLIHGFKDLLEKIYHLP